MVAQQINYKAKYDKIYQTTHKTAGANNSAALIGQTYVIDHNHVNGVSQRCYKEPYE